MENRRCCLRHTYLAVKTQADKSFGGNQNWATGYMMRKYGCGVVAMGDVLIYLGIHRLPCNTDLLYGMLREDGCLSYPRYERYLRKMNKRYLGIIPGFGVPNFQLARAMNRYFRHYRIDLRARWCLSSGKMLERIQDSLSKDYPVILAIGQYRDKKQKIGEPYETVSCHFDRLSAHALLAEEKADSIPPGKRRLSACHRDKGSLCGGHRYGERLSADFFLGKRIFYLLEGISGIREKIQQLLGQQYLPDSGKEGEEA